MCAADEGKIGGPSQRAYLAIIYNSSSKRLPAGLLALSGPILGEAARNLTTALWTGAAAMWRTGRDQSRSRYRANVISVGASPLLFEPDMDWKSFSGANIIHDY